MEKYLLTFVIIREIIKKNNMALEVTDATFDEVVLKSDKPVLVDFWAAWCGPCRMLAPIVEELTRNLKEKQKLLK